MATASEIAVIAAILAAGRELPVSDQMIHFAELLLDRAEQLHGVKDLKFPHEELKPVKYEAPKEPPLVPAGSKEFYEVAGPPGLGDDPLWPNWP